jgi:hypothetical protein
MLPVGAVVIGFAIYFGGNQEIVEAIAWGVGGSVAIIASLFLSDLWFRCWSVEVSDSGIRVISKRAEHNLEWSQIKSVGSHPNSPGWRISWGWHQSLSLAERAYDAFEFETVAALIQAGKEYGSLPSTTQDFIQQVDQLHRARQCRGRDER